ncbi:unnamed protein product, partial [Rotaria magnacalcarata]
MTSTPPVQCLKVSQNENSLESNTLATSPQSS